MSVRDRISPYNDTISSKQVMRIKKKINYRIINWSNTKFSKLTSEELYDRQKGGFSHEILGVKGWIHCRLVLLSLKFIYEGLFTAIGFSNCHLSVWNLSLAPCIFTSMRCWKILCVFETYSMVCILFQRTFSGPNWFFSDFKLTWNPFIPKISWAILFSVYLHFL